jgi:hypothetical protein
MSMDPVEYASNFLQQVLLESLDWPADRPWAYILRRLDNIADVAATTEEANPRMRAVQVARRAVEQELSIMTNDPVASDIETADRAQLSQAISRALNHLTEEVGRLRAARPAPQ